MKFVFKIYILFIVSTFSSVIFANSQENQYPVILVHGNGGWGRSEKDGFLYWGGQVDLEKELNNTGYDVRVATVAPYSSNWDRACELYAQLMGLDYIDYGKAHSEKFGHKRIVRISESESWSRVWSEEGIYPQWGESNERGINKIHLIGHSQGGQTVRLFAQLLEEGMGSEVEAVLGKNPSREEIEKAVVDGRLSGLFAGIHNDWVKSVSTFATPNDGTTSADIVNYTPGDLIAFFATPINGIVMDSKGDIDNTNFSLKLDQWEMKRKSGESFSSYFWRTLTNSKWKGTKDFSNYDLGTIGAREMNTWVKEQANIYYFSYSCLGTRRMLIGYNQIPDEHLNPNFALNARAMGAYLNYLTGITYEWLPNDGYVNTISQDGAKVGRAYNNISAFNFEKKAKIGMWNSFKLLSKTDHEDIIGRDTSEEMDGLINFYAKHIEILYSL